MALNGITLARTLECAAAETQTLSRFLNDLDGWGGVDCDTGTNAALTFAAMRDALADIDESASFAEALELAINAGITKAVGTIGVILTSQLAAWARSIDGAAALTPVAIRRMLTTDLASDDQRLTVSEAITRVLAEAHDETWGLGVTIPDEDYLISWYSLSAQQGIVNAINEQSNLLDAGACVLAVLFASFDSTVRDSTDGLESLAQMLAGIADADSYGPAPRPNPPQPGRDFTVDIVWEGTVDEATRLFDSIEAVGAKLNCVGAVDLFSMGTWRLHVDTSAPLSVHPRFGRTLRFCVADARPDEELGVDELDNTGITHRGVRLLERRPRRRVERARVIACTKAPGLVDYLARSGAVVLLYPTIDDAPGIEYLAACSSTGVALILPADEADAELAHACQQHLATGEEDATVLIVAPTRDDLSVLSAAQTCAGFFVPQPGGRATAPVMQTILADGARRAHAASSVVALAGDGDELGVIAAVSDIARISPTRWRLLMGRGDGPELAALIRQLIARYSPIADITVIDGGQDGTSLIQGLRA